MSKLAKAITAAQTREVMPVSPLMSVEYSEIPYKWQAARAYEIRAIFGSRVWITDHAVSSSAVDIVALHKAKMRRMVVEEVFGEFRPLLRDMRLACFDRDVDKLRRLVDELDEQMFQEGVGNPLTPSPESETL